MVDYHRWTHKANPWLEASVFRVNQHSKLSGHSDLHQILTQSMQTPVESCFGGIGGAACPERQAGSIHYWLEKEPVSARMQIARAAVFNGT